MKDSSPRDIAEGVLIAAGSLQFIAAIVWTIWIIRAYRRDKKRVREGLCLTCGFDLRESRDRCPECGSPILRPKD
jgi:hypothetical protein